jgi:3-hydroxyisobutyrate dehydrogenase-like beta-hydroxyacid dehydrogenase
VAPSVGFIGFGEAGSTIAGGLKAAGIDRLSAFDIKTVTTDFGPRIREAGCRCADDAR